MISKLPEIFKNVQFGKGLYAQFPMACFRDFAMDLKKGLNCDHIMSEIYVRSSLDCKNYVIPH